MYGELSMEKSKRQEWQLLGIESILLMCIFTWYKQNINILECCIASSTPLMCAKSKYASRHVESLNIIWSCNIWN